MKIGQAITSKINFEMRVIKNNEKIFCVELTFIVINDEKHAFRDQKIRKIPKEDPRYFSQL